MTAGRVPPGHRIARPPPGGLGTDRAVGDGPSVTQELHQRYLQQAGWTRPLRQRAYSCFGLPGLRRILEVGSGTGAITSELRRLSGGTVIGLDRDRGVNAFAAASDRKAALVTGLGEKLPFPTGSFDLTCCHFLLLWLADPLPVLLEMMRVTRPAGGVLCLAEPDYGGRIDYPDRLANAGALQEQALRAQGAETRIGRRLRALLHDAGLSDVEVGVLGGEWPDADPSAQGEPDLEWQTLAGDLAGRLPPPKLEELAAAFVQAERDQSRLLYVPTFFGWGVRPTGVPEARPRTRRTE